MRIPQLPFTDLARIAVLPRDQQLYHLRQVSSGGAGPNYNPTRANLPDLLNRQAGPFTSERAAWPIIKKGIVKKCRSKSEQTMNILVAKSLYRYCRDQQVEAREIDAFPISFSTGTRLTCWAPAILVYPHHLALPFMDFRRSRYLNREAQRFLFSTQHEAVRVNNPDYSELRLEILKFENEHGRPIRTVSEAGFRLFSYDQLEEMISYTQRLWTAVNQERANKKRNSGKPSPGSLL